MFSHREFFKDDELLVYSDFQISEDRPKATGRRMTVAEAERRFGTGIFEQIIDKGGAVIFEHPNHPDNDPTAGEPA